MGNKNCKHTLPYMCPRCHQPEDAIYKVHFYKRGHWKVLPNGDQIFIGPETDILRITLTVV